MYRLRVINLNKQVIPHKYENKIHNTHSIFLCVILLFFLINNI